MEHKRKGNVNCCVKSCKNIYRNTTSDVKFYQFPIARYKNTQFQDWKRWLRIVNDTPDWEPKTYTRICSVHFVGYRASSMPTNPGYCPSIIKRKELCMQPEEKALIDSFEITMKRRENLLKNSIDLIEGLNEGESSEEDEDFPSGPYNVDKGIQVEVFDIVTGNCNVYNDTKTFVCNQYVRGKICDAETQVYIPKISVFNRTLKKNFYCDKCVNDNENIFIRRAFVGISLIKTDEEMFDLTGVTKTIFNLLLKIIPDNRSNKIPKEKRLFLMLSKLKTGLSLNVISAPLRIHRLASSRAFVVMLKALKIDCEQFIPWPSQKDIQISMPNDFRQLFPNCRVIIDCIEIPLESDSSVDNRLATILQLKNISSVKFLVGFTPNGMISFMWSYYGKQIDDCQIVIKSGLLDFLESGDQILSLKNLPVLQSILKNEEKCQLVVIKLNDSYDSQDYTVQSEISRRFERIKTRIQQTMQRLRSYEILNRLSIELTLQADEIVFMCGVLANLQPRIPFTRSCDTYQCHQSS